MEQIKESWYYCPAGHKTGQRIEKNSNIENTPIWCKHCKKAYYPVIKDGRICQITKRKQKRDRCVKNADIYLKTLNMKQDFIGDFRQMHVLDAEDT